MHSENLVINKSGDDKEGEEVVETLPHGSVSVLADTFVKEPISRVSLECG